MIRLADAQLEPQSGMIRLADAQLEPQSGMIRLADAQFEVPTGVGAPTIGLKKSLSHGSTQRGNFGGRNTPDSHSQQAFQTFRGCLQSSP